MSDNTINSSLPLYGLIGYPLSHSFSPAYFSKKFLKEGIDAVYTAFPLQHIEDFPDFMKMHPQLRGLNVTTPYKQAVISFLDELDMDAGAIGAVNCIGIKDGQLSGYNTDWLGFRDSLLPLLQSQHTNALVLGNGGAALAVRYALQRLGIAFQRVSATAGKADFLYSDLTPAMLQAHKLIINTTILGTNGIGCPELPYEALSSQHLLYDLVYNPPLTPFLQEGLTRGATVKNGQDMLEIQAEAAWRIWQR